MDFKFEARPDVIWGETARLGYAASCLRYREIKDLVFFYKAVYGYIDVDVSDYVGFYNHPRTRRGQSTGCYLTFPACKTSTLQALYFVRIVKLWNNLCNEAFPSGFTSLGCFSLT